MKGFIIFITIVLAVYTTVNWYIHRNVVTMAALNGTWGAVLRWGLLALILVFPLSRLLYGLGDSAINKPFIWIGSYWLGLMFYLFSLFLLKDLLRLINAGVKAIPVETFTAPPGSRMILLGVAALMLLAMLFGAWRANRPVVTRNTIVLPGYPANREPLTLAWVSDVHLGALVGENRLQRMVRDINALEPDVVVIGGDLLDEPAAHVAGWEQHLRRLRATHGVYGILGNHEYYHGLDGAVQFFQDSDIRLLRDEGVLISDALLLVGLEDRPTVGRFTETVPSIRQTVENARQAAQQKQTGTESSVSDSLPLVLLHHTPLKLQEAAQAGAALQISGHTHGGQLWPSAMFVKMSYGVVSGYYRLHDRLQLHISPGYGTWGPPMRIGTTPEILLLTLTGSKSE